MAKKVTPRFKPAPVRQFFKAWRKYRGLTQEALAERTGLTPSSVSQLENGKQGFSDSTLALLAEALNCEPGDLLMRNPQDGEAPWSVWNAIPPQRRAQALEILRTFQGDRTGTDG